MGLFCMEVVPQFGVEEMRDAVVCGRLLVKSMDMAICFHYGCQFVLIKDANLC